MRRNCLSLCRLDNLLGFDEVVVVVVEVLPVVLLSNHVGKTTTPRLIRARFRFLINFAVENMDSAPAGSRKRVGLVLFLLLMADERVLSLSLLASFVAVMVVAAGTFLRRLLLLSLGGASPVSAAAAVVVVLVVVAEAAVEISGDGWKVTFDERGFILAQP